MKYKMPYLLSAELLSEFTDWLIDECNIKPRTIESITKHLRYLSHYLKNKPFNQESCREYLRYLREEGRQPATRANSLYAMRMFCRFLKERKQGMDFSSELPRIKVPLKPVEVLSIAEIDSILTLQRNYRYEGLQGFWDMVLSVIARTGRRVAEIAALQVKDIDVSQQAILLREPKNGNPEYIPLPKDLLTRMLSYSKGKAPDDYIFSHRFTNGKAITPTSIRNELKLRAQLAGIQKDVHPHMLRHSYPIELLRMKMPIAYVQRLMGHKRLDSTLRYIHMVLDDIRVASSSHPLNQAELSALEIIEGIEKDLQRYSLSKREDLQVDVRHRPHKFSLSITW